MWSVSRRAGDSWPAERADEDGAPQAAELHEGQLGVMLEGGPAVPGGLGLGHPELDALEFALKTAGVLLRVGHATTGRHQVQLPGPHRAAPSPGCRGAAPRPTRAT